MNCYSNSVIDLIQNNNVIHHKITERKSPQAPDYTLFAMQMQKTIKNYIFEYDIF